LLGIKDKPPRVVVGSTAFDNPVEMASKLFSILKFRVDIEEINHPDGRVVAFSIPSRPSGTAYDFEGQFLMRSGEELLPMSEDRLRKIFSEGQLVFESRIARTGLIAEDIIHLLDTQSYFDLTEMPYPVNRDGVLGRLIREKLILDKNGFYDITNLGALLFAKNLNELLFNKEWFNFHPARKE